MNTRIKNINLAIILLISFGILFFYNNIKISQAVLISATGYPSNIKREKQPDLRIYSITKSVGLTNNGNELSTAPWVNTFFTSNAGLNISVFDYASEMNCQTTKGDSCGIYVYGTFDGKISTDDIKRDVSSNNPSVVSCNRGGCVLTGNEGNARITISFVDEGGFVYTGPQDNDINVARSRRLFKFSIPSLYYDITVIRGNTVPEVTQNNPNNISTNTAQLNWTYKDKENDQQSRAEMQVSTNPQFNNNPKPYSLTGAGNIYPLSQLIPGTKYYARIRAKDSRDGWSAWSNVKEFTTLSNPILNPANFTCGATNLTTIPGKYNTVNVNWNYTGSVRLNLQIRSTKVGTNITYINNINNISRSGNYTQSGLEAGSTYKLEIRFTDVNNPTRSQIKYCEDFSLEDYTNPTSTFSLTNTTNRSTAGEEGTLTIGKSEGVRAIWNITDPSDIIIPNGCSIRTIDNGNNPVRTDKIFNLSGLEFNSSIVGSNIPQNESKDLKYRINLKCNVKAGYTGIDKNIYLVVTPTSPLITSTTPIVRCNILDGRRSVSETNKTIDIGVDIGNISDNYTLKAGVNNNDKLKNIKNGSGTVNEKQKRITLDYTGVAFGRYQPWVEVTTSSGTAEAICPAITNFGDSRFKEVNP